METEVRTINADEFKKIISILIDVYLDGYMGLSKYAYTKVRDVKRYLKWLYKTDPTSFFVGFVNGIPQGFIAGEKNYMDEVFGDISEIHEFVVRKTKKHTPLTNLLITKILVHFRGKKVGLWVGEHNIRAYNFYKKYGFEEKQRKGIWIRMLKEEN